MFDKVPEIYPGVKKTAKGIAVGLLGAFALVNSPLLKVDEASAEDVLAKSCHTDVSFEDGGCWGGHGIFRTEFNSLNSAGEAASGYVYESMFSDNTQIYLYDNE